MNTSGRELKIFAARAALISAAFLVAASGFAADKAPGSSATAASAAKPVDPASRKYTLPNLSSHPRLGCASAGFRIAGQDGVDQKAVSNSVRADIPSCDLHNPIALSLAALRRMLALDSHTAGQVAAGIDKLIRDQEQYFTNPATLNRVRDTQKALVGAKTVEAMDKVVSDLWSIILQLEEDALSKAEKTLRDAEKTLREALQRNAPDPQMRKATEETRKAMEDAARDMAQKADKADPQAKRDFEELSKKLAEMKKLLEDMKTIDPNLARQMDKEAQKMLEMMKKQNQQSGDPQNQQDQKQKGQDQKSRQSGPQKEQQKQERQSLRQMMDQMMQDMQQMQDMQKMKSQLDKLIEEQNRLMEDTAKHTGQHKFDMNKVRDALEKFTKHLDRQADGQSKDIGTALSALSERNQARLSAVTEEVKNRTDLDPAEKIKKIMQQSEEDQKDIKPLQADLTSITMMKEILKGIADTLQKDRAQNRDLTEAQARQALAKLVEIQKALQKNEKQKQEQDKKDPQNAQDGQQGQKGQNQEEEMADLIEKMMQQRARTKAVRPVNSSNSVSSNCRSDTASFWKGQNKKVSSPKLLIRPTTIWVKPLKI